MFQTLGNFSVDSTPGLLGLAQHCLPPILPSSWNARAGEILDSLFACFSYSLEVFSCFELKHIHQAQHCTKMGHN